jgi:hypothetical protein
METSTAVTCVRSEASTQDLGRDSGILRLLMGTIMVSGWERNASRAPRRAGRVTLATRTEASRRLMLERRALGSVCAPLALGDLVVTLAHR